MSFELLQLVSLICICVPLAGDSPLEQQEGPRRLTLHIPEPADLEWGSSESLLDTPVPDTPVTPLTMPLTPTTPPASAGGPGGGGRPEPPDITRSMMDLSRADTGAGEAESPEEKAHNRYVHYSLSNFVRLLAIDVIHGVNYYERELVKRYEMCKVGVSSEFPTYPKKDIRN